MPWKANAIFNDRSSKDTRSSIELRRHDDMESALGRYSGLILYLKEMDEDRYAKLCAVRDCDCGNYVWKCLTCTVIFLHGKRASRQADEGNVNDVRWDDKKGSR